MKHRLAPGRAARQPRIHLPRGKWRGQQVPELVRAAILASLLIPVLLGGAPPAGAIDGSALQKGPRGYWHIVMPSDLVQSMRDSVPRFEIAPDSTYTPLVRETYPYGEHAAPFALIRDLNGDAREDVVLDGREGEARVIYLAVSRGRGYRWIGVIHENPPRYPRGALEWHPEVRVDESWFALVQHDDAGSKRDAFLWSEEHGLRHMVVFSCGISRLSRPERDR